MAADQFYVGSILTVFSRQLRIVGFADEFTRRKFESSRGKTFAMVKPDAYLSLGKIIMAVEQSGFKITNLKMAKFTEPLAEEFYAEHRGKPFFRALISLMCEDLVVGLELVADNCVTKWRELLGSTDSNQARARGERSIRAIFGENETRNAAHGSDSPESAARELEFFFGPGSKMRPMPIFNSCSCCVIKPHVVEEGNVGSVVDQILSEGF